MVNLELIKMKRKNVYKLRLSGSIQIDEINTLKKKVKSVLQKPASDFRVYSDLRGFKPANKDVQAAMTEIQSLFKEKGMKKVAILVDSSIVKIQLLRLHAETGIKGKDEFYSADEEGYEQQIKNFLTQDDAPDRSQA